MKMEKTIGNSLHVQSSSQASLPVTNTNFTYCTVPVLCAIYTVYVVNTFDHYKSDIQLLINGVCHKDEM